ncbi:hypothetical protein MMK25_32075, partial [Bacillus cereus]|nr:hypothetical protein [Bacillus cereus]
PPATHTPSPPAPRLPPARPALVDCINPQTVSIPLEGHGREEMSEGIDVSRRVGWISRMDPGHLTFGGSLTTRGGLEGGGGLWGRR